MGNGYGGCGNLCNMETGWQTDLGFCTWPARLAGSQFPVPSSQIPTRLDSGPKVTHIQRQTEVSRQQSCRPSPQTDTYVTHSAAANSRDPANKKIQKMPRKMMRSAAHWARLEKMRNQWNAWLRQCKLTWPGKNESVSASSMQSSGAFKSACLGVGMRFQSLTTNCTKRA